MAELFRFLVRSGFVFKPGIRAVRGSVLALDPEDPKTRRAIALGRLVRTDAAVSGSLQFTDGRPVSAVSFEDEDTAPEVPVGTEAAAQALARLRVRDLKVAAQDQPEDVLALALAIETAKPSPRPRAISALEDVLEGIAREEQDGGNAEDEATDEDAAAIGGE